MPGNSTTKLAKRTQALGPSTCKWIHGPAPQQHAQKTRFLFNVQTTRFDSAGNARTRFPQQLSHKIHGLPLLNCWPRRRVRPFALHSSGRHLPGWPKGRSCFKNSAGPYRTVAQQCAELPSAGNAPCWYGPSNQTMTTTSKHVMPSQGLHR